jgi:hypothetical protein
MLLMARNVTRTGFQTLASAFCSFLVLGWCACSDAAPPAAGDAVRTAQAGIPITFTLPKASYVTIVVDDASGKRVRNICAETFLPQGVNTVTWDGYDEGDKQPDGSIVRHRVPPGDYVARGLTHDGIHLRYEFPVYTSGNPPWFTLDGTGGWLADHTPASGIAFLPKSVSPYGNGQPQMAIGSVSGESGSPQVWLAEDGHRLFGGPKVDGWFGARSMARDEGPNPDADYYAYGLYVGGNQSNKFGLFGLTPTPGKDIVHLFEIANPAPINWNADHTDLAIAARNGVVVISDDLNNRLIFVDVVQRKEIAILPVTKPRGICFDAQGHLYLVLDGKVLRYDNASPENGTLGDPTVVIASGLEEPRNLLVTSEGNLFVTDWGHSHQVKVFSSAGQLLRVIGESGGPAVGPYDDHRMHFPNGMAIDDQGVLWVTEDDSLPRRISRWRESDGQFIDALYGGVQYGGGGVIDPADRTRFYYADNGQTGGAYGGLELKLDWATGTSKVTGVYFRDVEDSTDSDHPAHECMPADDLPEGLNIPDYPVQIGKYRYLISTYDCAMRQNGSAGIWKLDANGVAWPVAFIGGGGSHLETFFKDTTPRPGGPRFNLLNRSAVVAEIEKQLKAQNGKWEDAFIIWSDLNGNHRIDPDEITVKVFPYQESAFDPSAPETANNHATYFSGHSLDPHDLAFTGAWSVQSAPPTIDANGIPIYDVSKIAFSMRPSALMRSWFDQPDRFDPAPGGWLINGMTRGYKDGQLTWTYPGRSKVLPPQKPGEVVSATRLMGPVFTPNQGDAGPTVAVGGDNGAMYLMTVDGLFLQTLGGDIRTHPLIRFPVAKRGMLIDNYSFNDELFHSQLTRTDAGPTYLVAGKEDSSIFDVEGFETVKRQTFEPLKLTADVLAMLPAESVTRAIAKSRPTLAVPMLSSDLPVDASLKSWTDASKAVATIDNRAWGSIAVSPQNLYAFWGTGDPHLLESGAGDYRFAFKYGGALDLMIGANPRAPINRSSPVAGDLRLLVTRVNGQLRAVLYRPVAPGASGNSVEYSSPVGHIAFDDVTDISNQVTLAQDGGNYEISVPLSVLGLAPKSQLKISGDIGLLRGNGTQTTQRVYWSNSDTSIVSDIPSEAALKPSNWGVLQFKDGPSDSN